VELRQEVLGKTDQAIISARAVSMQFSVNMVYIVLMDYLIFLRERGE
jgi:hypothetical protein